LNGFTAKLSFPLESNCTMWKGVKDLASFCAMAGQNFGIAGENK
jgi:hypothetical protein